MDGCELAALLNAPEPVLVNDGVAASAGAAGAAGGHTCAFGPSGSATVLFARERPASG